MEHKIEMNKTVEQTVIEQLKEEKAKMEEEFNQQILQIKADAERLISLTEEDRVQYLLKQREDALLKREETLTKRELANEGAKRLMEKNLPPSMIGCIHMDSAESLEKSLEILEKEFTKAVDEAVNKRLISDAPKAHVNYEDDPFLKGLNN